MSGDEVNARLRRLPSVERLGEKLGSRDPLTIGAARRAVDEARAAIRAGGAAPSLDDLATSAEQLLDDRRRRRLHKVINATGVLIHTNLGRAPLGDEQLAAVSEVARGYSNLEFDVTTGGRGDRHHNVNRLLTEMTGAEAALVVNNNAAAVLVTLAALCREGEVIISRGELVEIGGEFRIPEVMIASGALLAEVGTTNRTHIGDYEKAIGRDTVAIMKVHPSNYRLVGFTASVAARDLARLARGRGLCFIHDLGSGLLVDEGSLPLEDPLVSDALEEGADIVTFSGDKLMGGPQAGVVAGRAELVEKVARHPLVRAMRPDKMTIAALEATLTLYLQGRLDELPLWRMARTPVDELRQRAESLVGSLRPKLADVIKLEVVDVAGAAGGGSLPERDLPSVGLAITHGERSSAELRRTLAYGDIAVIARIEEDRLLLDLRTVLEEDLDLLRGGLERALS